MKLISTVQVYLRLFRPQGAAATAAAVLIGSLIMGQRDSSLLAVLFFIGVLSHTYVFVLNEYADINVDQQSHYLQQKPLVSGIITKQKALFIALASLAGAYGSTVIFFPSVYPVFSSASHFCLLPCMIFSAKKYLPVMCL